jgi:hypothetical protein
MVRKSIKIKRKPITMLSKQGYTKSGGWMTFNRPSSTPPKYVVPKGHRLLFCPYCMEWQLFKFSRDHVEEGRYECQGWCKGAHSEMYHVKQANDLWFEGIPLNDIRKMDLSILRPTSARRRL